MPMVYMWKENYDKLIRDGKDPKQFMNELLEKALLPKEKDIKKETKA